jgi:predicted O-methyltransferase YrrM
MIDGIMDFPIVPYYLAIRQARKIDGWLLNGESRFLFSAARLIKAPNVIVEIGAWHGKSTVLLCRGSLAGDKVPIYSFDLFALKGSDADVYREHVRAQEHTYLNIWQRNVARAGASSLAHPVVGCSWETAAQVVAPIGLLFVDGDHSAEGVMQDWRAFSPRLAEQAIVMFHDYDKSGVRGAVDEVAMGWNFGRVGISAILWRGF